MKIKGRKGFFNLIAKHTLAMTVYFIWTERNSRILQKKFKQAGLLSHEAATQIRLLLLNYPRHIPELARIQWNVGVSRSQMQDLFSCLLAGDVIVLGYQAIGASFRMRRARPVCPRM